jgi:hypothetical protein
MLFMVATASAVFSQNAFSGHGEYCVAWGRVGSCRNRDGFTAVDGDCVAGNGIVWFLLLLLLLLLFHLLWLSSSPSTSSHVFDGALSFLAVPES